MSRGLQRNFPSYILIMDSSLQTQKRSTVQPYHFRPSQFVVFYYASMGGLTYILTQREPQGHPTFSLLTPTINPWLDHEPWVVSLGEKACIFRPNCWQLERWLVLGICPLYYIPTLLACSLVPLETDRWVTWPMKGLRSNSLLFC